MKDSGREIVSKSCLYASSSEYKAIVLLLLQES